MGTGKGRKLMEYFLWGTKYKKHSLRHQMARVITICCIITVTVQAVVMLAIILNQYVRQEREDTLSLLESGNIQMDNAIQYLEEMVLSIQHNAGVRSFLTAAAYNRQSAGEQLKTVANLFSERNRTTSQEPLVERVYLFRESGESIYNLYYPTIVSGIEEFRIKYDEMNARFLSQEEAFYFEVEEEYVNLCVQLYDDGMEPMGTCILVLNKSGMEEIYANVEKMRQFGWTVSQGERVILGRGDPEMPGLSTMGHSMRSGFGLTLRAAVSPWQIYSSLGTTMLLVAVISAAIILANSFVGYTVARLFVHPLETVAEKIKQVGKGNFNTKLGEYRAEELNNISEKFNEMTEYINMLVTEVYETQLIAKQAQIQYLQAQMNPHFLFNVLSMIELKAAINEDTEVQQMIYKLSKLYQGKIFRKNEHFIRLGEEMEIVDFYLSLQNSRFGDKITYSICYEGEKEGYRRLMVPRLSVEPSVENAVCHGLEPKRENGHIKVHIFREREDTLCITIADDGVGFEPGRLEEGGEMGHSHVGIYNTHKMIRNLCGEEYGLQVASTPGQGTKVTIRLPIRLPEEDVRDLEAEELL